MAPSFLMIRRVLALLEGDAAKTAYDILIWLGGRKCCVNSSGGSSGWAWIWGCKAIAVAGGDWLMGVLKWIDDSHDEREESPQAGRTGWTPSDNDDGQVIDSRPPTSTDITALTVVVYPQ